MRTELELLKDKFNAAASEALTGRTQAGNWYQSKNNAYETLVNEMQTPFLIFGIILLCFAAFLIVAIIIQSNKSEKGLSGTITGGSADTFYGRNKGKNKNKALAIATIVVIALFIISVLAVYVLQYDLSGISADMDSLDSLYGYYNNQHQLNTHYANSVQSQIDSMIASGAFLSPDPLA